MPLPRIGLIAVAVLALLALLALPAPAGTIDLIVNAYATYNDAVTPIPTKCGDAILTPIEPGSVITYEIAVTVDPAAAHPQGNMGLATIVFDVLDAYAAPGDYEMPYITAAESGYAPSFHYPYPPAALHYVTDPMYIDSGTTKRSAYNGGWDFESFEPTERRPNLNYYGGWGFDNAGLPIGGDVTVSPGSVIAAGALTPLSWTADLVWDYPGLQPYARLGVGIGTYTFPSEDTACGGMQGGFGQDLSNAYNVIPGDGHWLMFRGSIDTSGWTAGADYGWNIVPTNGAVYSPTVDYNYDQGGGFRIGVPSVDMTGDSFAFTLIPEPATSAALLLAALGLTRPRR
jgi:hypothetical protein